MYNAPACADGSARYAATNRRIKIELQPSEHVQVEFGASEGTFGLSVTDNFGRLELAHLRKSIRRCATHHDQIEQKQGGAGLGLYIVARTARQFIVNVDPGKRTEVIALWSLAKSRQRSGRHSLHYFEQALRLEPRVRARGTRGDIPTLIS
jgi:hypothetical protein